MPSCPKDEASWREAARKMNCESVTQNCASKSHKFQYHCLINSHMNATVEVCALSRIIFGTVPSLIIVVYITTECKVNFFSNCVQLYLKFGSIFDFLRTRLLCGIRYKRGIGTGKLFCTLQNTKPTLSRVLRLSGSLQMQVVSFSNIFT